MSLLKITKFVKNFKIFQYFIQARKVVKKLTDININDIVGNGKVSE